MAATTAFAYKALPSDSFTIRLFRINSPAGDDGLIRCSLKHLCLGPPKVDTSDGNQYQRQDYTALSYTWESKHPVTSILLDGKALSIGRNLWDFLRRLSLRADTDLPQWLWADAICINQDDLEEKKT